MRRVLLIAAALALVSLASEARAQYPNYVRPSNVPTPGIVRYAFSQGFAPQPRHYYSNSMYGPGYSYTRGYGPFGNFSQNTTYGSGYSYTSGYGVPSYGYSPYGYGFGGGF